MSFWNNLRSKVEEMSGSLQTKAKQFKNDAFAEACMAVCGLIAAADGDVDPSERQKTASLIMSNETLKIFPAAKLKERFDFYCDKLMSDFDFGKIEAIQAVSKLKGKPDQARAVVQIAIVIGGADGNFDPAERKMVKEICNAVDINPADFDL